MRNTNAILWEERPEAENLIERELRLEFEKYFLGDYIRGGYALTDVAISINGFLKTLTRQELNLFLELKGSFGRDYANGKTYIEILNHCVSRTNPNIQRPLLFAMTFIVERHEMSREKLINNPKSLEKIVNTESESRNLAINILGRLNEDYKPPIQSQYSFKPSEEFAFYSQFKKIIARANGYVHYIDNYADNTILEFIDNEVNASEISNIKIITQHNTKKMKLAVEMFAKQYSWINVELRASSSIHDRYLFFDNESWVLGPSVKDGGKKACSIAQLKNTSELNARNMFDEEWSKARQIV